MKKVLFIIAVVIVAMTATAQEQKDSVQIIEMNRTFSVGGKAIMCLRSNNAEKKSLQPLEWTLKNDHIGNSNIVVLDVKNSRTGATIVHQSWSDGILVHMKVKKGKPAMYEVYDDMFSHLRVVDVDMGFIILFYSELIKR